MQFSNRLGWMLAFAMGTIVILLLDDERRRRRQAGDHRFTTEKLNVWDSEGGNIPSVQTVRPLPEDPASLH